jgi:hypothetical protein
MATTYTWNVVQLDAYPQVDGKSEVVFNVHWTLAGEEAGFTGSVYGAQAVTLDPDAPFTPYASLTQDQVIGWVKDALGEEQVASLEANVAEQINNQVAPPVIHPALPW